MPLHELHLPLPGVRGDDWAYDTMIYADVPAGFRIRDLTVPDDCPMTAAIWSKLCESADAVFHDHEIVGRTVADFFANLNKAWALHADTFERLLEVYDDDIARPILGRTETVEYGTPETPVTMIDTRVDTEHRKGDSKHYDLPLSGEASEASMQDTSETYVDAGNITNTHTHTGTVKTTLSDIGVRPNYDTLNGFLDKNRTYVRVFCDMLRDCFTLHMSIR